jgi:hypothetical protein
MRKRKVVKIDNREIMVNELSVQDILDILGESEEAAKEEPFSLSALLEKHLIKMTDLKIDDFKTMTPSEIEQVYQAWREVNSAFFVLADRLGLSALAVQVKENFMKSLLGLFQNLSNPAT